MPVFSCSEAQNDNKEVYIYHMWGADSLGLPLLETLTDQKQVEMPVFSCSEAQNDYIDIGDEMQVYTSACGS